MASFQSKKKRDPNDNKETLQWSGENYIELEEGAGRPK